MSAWHHSERGRAVMLEYNRRYRKANPKQCMLNAARKRARAKGVPCSITLEDFDIPEHCPVLGLKLQQHSRGFQDSSATLDRRVPELGYVPGNVQVICYRANRIKNDATVEEVRAVLTYMEK